MQTVLACLARHSKSHRRFPISCEHSWWFHWIPCPQGQWNRFLVIFLHYRDLVIHVTTFTSPSAGHFCPNFVQAAAVSFGKFMNLFCLTCVDESPAYNDHEHTGDSSWAQLTSITARQRGPNYAAPLPLTTHLDFSVIWWAVTLFTCDARLLRYCKVHTNRGPSSLKGQRMTHCEWTIDGVTKTIFYNRCPFCEPKWTFRLCSLGSSPAFEAHPGANTFPAEADSLPWSDISSGPSASRNTFSVSTITDGNARIGRRSTFPALTLAWLYIEPSPCGGVRPAGDPVDSDPGAVFDDDPHPRSDAGRPLEPWVCRHTREPTVLSRVSCRPFHQNFVSFHQPSLLHWRTPYCHRNTAGFGKEGEDCRPRTTRRPHTLFGQPGSPSFSTHWRYCHAD